jgi:hypothetical protein
MNVRPVGAELFHVGGQTHITKVIVLFCNFANAPKKSLKICIRKGGGTSEDWLCEMSNCLYTMRHPNNGRMCWRVALCELLQTARDDRLERGKKWPETWPCWEPFQVQVGSVAYRTAMLCVNRVKRKGVYLCIQYFLFLHRLPKIFCTTLYGFCGFRIFGTVSHLTGFLGWGI